MITERFIITSTKDNTAQVSFVHTLPMLRLIVELKQRNGFTVTVEQQQIEC